MVDGDTAKVIYNQAGFVFGRSVGSSCGRTDFFVQYYIQQLLYISQYYNINQRRVFTLDRSNILFDNRITNTYWPLDVGNIFHQVEVGDEIGGGDEVDRWSECIAAAVKNKGVT